MQWRDYDAEVIRTHGSIYLRAIAVANESGKALTDH